MPFHVIVGASRPVVSADTGHTGFGCSGPELKRQMQQPSTQVIAHGPRRRGRLAGQVNRWSRSSSVKRSARASEPAPRPRGTGRVAAPAGCSSPSRSL